MAITDHDQHFKGNVAQKAFLRREGKILLVQYPPNDIASGKWDMPGGRLHTGEKPEDGLRREVREEIGAEIEIRGILGVDSFVNLSGQETFVVIYDAKLVHPESPLVREEAEIHEIQWFNEREVLQLPIIYQGYKDFFKRVIHHEL